MFIEVLTPESTIYVGDVKGVQLPGIDGSFEILENHAPLVAALGKGKMKIIVSNNEEQFYEIEGGFAQTDHNKTAVLAEGAVAL
ncbi:MAG: ATP synthase F1 subunit epsilon [Taibaiella sp.]|nr:ATP synthase F1 subunit epsilon [Taibaiella sp.]